MATFQFVSSIAASPPVRLDLNDGHPFWIAKEGPDLSPAPVRRAVSSTMLADGDLISAATWSNRVLRLPIQLTAESTDEAAYAIQLLARELSRKTNILKVQLGSAPYFFRTFFAPDFVWEMRKLLVRHGVATLEIPAEPFAYGLKESYAAVTLNNDPAAGLNGCFFDLGAPLGDVETPLFLSIAGALSSGSGQLIAAIGTRRRGTPSAMPLVLQAEAFTTMEVDTSVQSNDAAMSGAGSNYIRCTFATQTAMTDRASHTNFPSSPSVDARGVYRVYARVRKSVANDPVIMQLRVTAEAMVVDNDPVTLPATTNIKWVDLGLVSCPMAPDPITDGYSDSELAVLGNAYKIRASRTSGTTNLDVDVLLFVPADDRFCLLKGGESSATAVVLDSARNMAYNVGASGEVRSNLGPEGPFGGPPMLTPAVTNRVVMIANVGTAGPSDDKTSTKTITPYYWPRYLFLRTPS